MKFYCTWFAIAILRRAKWDPAVLMIVHLRVGEAGIDWRRRDANPRDPFDPGVRYYFTWWTP